MYRVEALWILSKLDIALEEISRLCGGITVEGVKEAVTYGDEHFTEGTKAYLTCQEAVKLHKKPDPFVP